MSMLRENDGSVRPATISRWVLQTAGGLSATLRRLEADGRVARSDDPDDKRGRRIELTPDGEAFHDLVFGEICERYQFAFADVDIEAAAQQVIELIGAFERFGNHPPSQDWAKQQTPHRSTR